MSIQGRRKIPVPSFVPPPPIESNNDTSDARKVKLTVDMQRMMHLENALQLHLHQQKQQKNLNSVTISFADFSSISSKVETSPLSQKNGNESSDGKNDLGAPSVEELPDLLNLSRAERLWHDLYCLAVPALYHVAEHGDGIPRPKKRRRLAAMALELKPAVSSDLGSKNRLGELRRLIREASIKGVPQSKSEKALSLLLALKQEKENQKEPVNASNSSSSSSSHQNANDSSVVDSLLRDTSAATNGHPTIATTTIDDRIRVRAKERERNLEQAKAARKDPREERVAIADALYSYACHILRRKQSRSRFPGKAKKTTSGSKCVVTFQEIVQKCLPNQSRKEITRIMSDIVKVLSNSKSTSSKFLKWKDPKTGQSFGVPISKNAAVSIGTSDFKTVREILNREQISNATVGEK